VEHNQGFSAYAVPNNFLSGTVKLEFSVKISSQKPMHWRYCVKSKTVCFTLISYSYIEKRISSAGEVEIYL